MNTVTRSLFPVFIPALLLAACDRQDESLMVDSSPPSEGGPARAAAQAVHPTDATWVLQTIANGKALVLPTQSGGRILSLSCLLGEDRLRVNVPGFTPINSEERLSFGSGGEVEALVVDVRGKQQLGGVIAEGSVPPNLANLMRGPITASYGSQISGPHPGVPHDVAAVFAAACLKAAPQAPRARPGGSVNPCFIQNDRKLPAEPLRAIGTEPFWGARIEGRCVTYSHPEDQQGTRVWTRFARTSEGGVWSGALAGRPFELRTRAEPGCSDGMSDKRYPIAVELLVQGERRKGCAEPK